LRGLFKRKELKESKGLVKEERGEERQRRREFVEGRGGGEVRV
jgi:hypothetical protein